MPIVNTERVYTDQPSCALKGKVIWNPVKSIWFLFNLSMALFIAPWCFSFPALFLCIVLTGITLCFGHSLGMHRLLIHRSYRCPLWMEYLFVYLGVLVGMAGPIGMLKQHDLRDWAQRQSKCHPYLRHGPGILKDGWWQLNCDLVLENPPKFTIEPHISHSRFYALLESTWLLNAIFPAILLYWLGGMPWVIWGVCVRVTLSIGGHWLIGYFAHNTGGQTWIVKGAAVQGHNIRIAGLLSMGEAWHNNHHAFPGSAMLGLYNDEPDPGWWILNALHNVGIVKDIQLPEQLPTRKELIMEICNTENRVKKAPKNCSIVEVIKRIKTDS